MGDQRQNGEEWKKKNGFQESRSNRRLFEEDDDDNNEDENRQEHIDIIRRLADDLRQNQEEVRGKSFRENFDDINLI